MTISFSPLNISVRLCSCTPTIYVEGCSPGNDQSSRRILLSVLVKAGRSQPKRVLSTHRSDFPRRRRFPRGTPSHNNSFEPMADCIPRPNLRRLLVGLHVQGEPIWPAT